MEVIIALQRHKNVKTVNLTSDIRQVKVDCDLYCMASTARILKM